MSRPPTTSPEPGFLPHRRHTDAPKPTQTVSSGRPRAGSWQFIAPEPGFNANTDKSKNTERYGKLTIRRSLPGRNRDSKSVNRFRRETFGQVKSAVKKPSTRSQSAEKTSHKRPFRAIGGMKPSACTSYLVDLNLIRQYNEDQQHLQSTITDVVLGRIQVPHGILRSNIMEYAPWTAEGGKGVRFA